MPRGPWWECGLPGALYRLSVRSLKLAPDNCTLSLGLGTPSDGGSVSKRLPSSLAQAPLLATPQFLCGVAGSLSEALEGPVNKKAYQREAGGNMGSVWVLVPSEL